MKDQKTKETKDTKKPKDRFETEFEALPLEEKISRLMRMEAVTLSETFAFVVNSPMKVVEKVGDVISEIGAKLENEIRNAGKGPSCEPKPDSDAGAKAKTKSRPKSKARPAQSPR